MELDDLKNSWEDINDQIKKQQNLNSEMIDQMTRIKYNSTLRKVIYPEIAGISICLASVAYIVLSFGKLSTTVLQGAGILSILLLLTLSVISLVSIRQFSMTRNVNKTYAETLKDFALQKIRFNQLQKINLTLGYLLLVTTIILLSKFFSGKDIINNKYFWIFSFSFGYIFLLFFSKRVMKYYNKTLKQAEELLKELQA